MYPVEEGKMTDPPQPSAALVQKKRRPRSVTFAATLQLLLALTFLISTIVSYLYGPDAQAAAEAQVVSQGYPAAVLTQNNVRFKEGRIQFALPIAIVLALAALALLNLAGNRVGRILSWIFHPIMLIGGGYIIAGQVFTAQFLESAFKNSGNATLENINVQAVVDAAAQAFPTWLPYLLDAKFALATLGSLLIIILLAVPAAKTYFRKGEP